MDADPKFLQPSPATARMGVDLVTGSIAVGCDDWFDFRSVRPSKKKMKIVVDSCGATPYSDCVMKTTSLVQITGNTYPVKDQLKALGARWNAESKCWMIDADKADDARAVVAGSNAPARRRYTGAPMSYRSLSRPDMQARMEAAWNRREDKWERTNRIGI